MEEWLYGTKVATTRMFITVDTLYLEAVASPAQYKVWGRGEGGEG